MRPVEYGSQLKASTTAAPQAVKSQKKSGYTVEAVAETKSSSLFLRVWVDIFYWERCN